MKKRATGSRPGKTAKSNPPADAGAAPAHRGDGPGPPPRGRSRIKRLAFICILALIPVVLLAGLEIVLRLAGYGYSAHFFLPDRLKGQEILRDNQQFTWQFFPPQAARTPHPVVLARPKPPQTCRVFVFGESAAYGDPSQAFGLPRVLEVLLRNRYPGVHFEVVNVAMTAIDSNVILPIARDCARESGDVWVLYMGNNEVVGPYGGGTVFGPQVPSLPFIRTSISLNASKVGQLCADLRQRLYRGNSNQPSSVSLELFLNYKLRHDDPRMERVYAHFAQNLEDIMEIGVKAGAKVLVSTVAVNLKDCAPFASLHRSGLSGDQQAEWSRLYQAATNAEQAGKLSEAVDTYGQAAKIDDEWAELHFREARDLWNLGDFAASLRHFVLARDDDALRFRADTRINDLLRQGSSNRLHEGIAFLDGNEVLAQHSPHGVPGAELLYEHVHLNFTGNYWLARAMAEQITGALKPPVLAGQTPASGEWLSEEGCAAQLGLNDWDRYQTLEILRARLGGVPFTLQLNHAEQFQHLQEEIAQCKSVLARQTPTVSAQRCEQALSSSPKDWMLHQKLAQLLEQSTNSAVQARAVEEWRQVIALVPFDPEAHYELGVLLDRIGQAEEAETQLQFALKLKRDYYPSALNALGLVLARQDRLPEAVEKYEKAIQLKPNFAGALANLGTALDRLGRKTEAKARFEEAMRLDNTEAAVGLGQLLDENGEVTAAMARYEEVLRLDPQNADAHYNLARCLGMLGRSAEAQQHYAEALRIQPDSADTHIQFGVELAKSGQETEALQHFREAVRLKPDSQPAHKNLGVALARQQKFKEAVSQFEEAVRLDPNDTTAQKFLQAARAKAALISN